MTTPPPASPPTQGGFLTSRIPHVDGLRAVAILAVVGFHAGVPGFQSGFVGVDIFFVISGFLIINQIAQGIAAGTFSVWEFYARRVLRILPMFLLVLLVSLGLSLVILVSPYEWEWFGLSGGFAALFVSNHYFLSKQDYFDIDMFEKSLLHTWSLSVEEQFYLCVPLILLLLFAVARRWKLASGGVLATAAILIFGASLWGCIAFTVADGKNYGFYVALWRAWEFVAGGAIGFFAAHAAAGTVSRVWADTLGVLGCVVIAAAVGLGLDGGFYPGTTVLLPVVGTVLLILAGLAAPDAVTVRALSWRPIVGIGLISYGWYLWHWPLLSLGRIADFGRQDQVRDVILALASLGLAVLTYYLVERRVLDWRRRHGDVKRLSRRIVGFGVGASLAVFALMAAVAAPAHYAGRYGPAVAGNPGSEGQSAFACVGASCEKNADSVGILGGDSHADAIRRAVRRGAAKIGATVISPFKWTCPDADGESAPKTKAPASTCPKIRAAIAEVAQSHSKPLSFFVDFRRWNPKLADYEARFGPGSYARKLAREFAAYGADGARRLLVIGPVPEFDYKAVECVLRAKRYGMDPDFCAVPRSRIEAERKTTMDVLGRLAAALPNVRLADPIDLFCDATTCRPYVGETLLYKDTDHLSRFGARWFMHRMEADFLWAFEGRGDAPKDAAASAPGIRR